MEWAVLPSSETPPSRQLVDTVLDAVARGELQEGARLPSIRGLAAEVLVNPNTVARAYRDLETLGVARGQNGRGVFITASAPAIAVRERLQATLESFRRASFEALRNGHTFESLLAILRGESRGSEREPA